MTCVTAQNPHEVSGIAEIDPAMVSLQIQTICRGSSVAAAKVGMLYSSSIIRAVSTSVVDCRIPLLVVDPIMVATSGTRLLRLDALESLCSDLIPRAVVITPNLAEAEILCGHDIASVDELKAAAREIGKKFSTACVVKGGHLGSEDGRQRTGKRGRQIEERAEVAVVLFEDGQITVFSSPRLDMGKTHGTGCVFSAALTALLARGKSLRESVKGAKDYVTDIFTRHD